jgi:60 kDa SS-A/Ro ribonucleoprotein
MIVKSNLADVILWDDAATDLSLYPADSTLTLAQQIRNAARYMGGTNITAPFQHASRKYSRIVILTDEQSWLHDYTNGGSQALAAYRARTGANPVVYNWDLQGYGSLQFPENQVAVLAGWSDKVFDIMKLVETDNPLYLRSVLKGLDT